MDTKIETKTETKLETKANKKAETKIDSNKSNDLVKISSLSSDKFNYDIVSKILLLFIMLSPIFDIISFLRIKKYL